MAFSRDGELWVGRAGPDGPVETRRTFDGGDDLLNATLDWVYPEEIRRHERDPMEPDGARLAFLRLDERRVPKVAVGDPMPLHGATTLQRYPKAGDPNPVPSVCVVGRDTGAPTPLVLGRGDEVYVPWFRWTPDGRHVLVAVMPRDQKSVEVLRCDPSGGATTVLWRDEDPRWVDVPDPPRFLADGTAIVRSRRGGWWRLWRVRLDDGTATPLTPDGEDAGRMLAVDERAGAVFYAAERRATLRAAVARTTLAGGPVTLVTDGEASHTPSFASTGRVFLDDASRLDRPSRHSVRQADGTVLREVGDATTPAWTAAALPAPTLVQLAGEPGSSRPCGRARSTRPAGGPSCSTSTAGPGRASCATRSTAASSTPCSPRRASSSCAWTAVARRAAARTTRPRSRDASACEVEDLVAAVDRLAAEPWFDRARVGVWGWSYGGTFAALAARKRPTRSARPPRSRPSRTGACTTRSTPSGTWGGPTPAPTPTARPRPRPTRRACAARALLLAHGLADDNVHAQNTWWMVKALVAAGRPFDLRVYPERGTASRGTTRAVTSTAASSTTSCGRWAPGRADAARAGLQRGDASSGTRPGWASNAGRPLWALIAAAASTAGTSSSTPAPRSASCSASHA